LFEPEVSRPLEDILRWAGEQHLAVIEKDDLLADCRGKSDLVGGVDHRMTFSTSPVNSGSVTKSIRQRA